MKAYRTRQSGFTLVEILIVVIILGILAAIVIPQFTNASQDARKSNMVSQLQTLRSQIELYKLQHQDKAPAITALATTASETGGHWEVFLECTDVTGAPNAGQVKPDNAFPFGPYMQAKPVNPLTNSSNVAALGSPATNVGWTYDASTGQIHGIVIDGAAAAVESDDAVHDLTGAAITF